MWSYYPFNNKVSFGQKEQNDLKFPWQPPLSCYLIDWIQDWYWHFHREFALRSCLLFGSEAITAYLRICSWQNDSIRVFACMHIFSVSLYIYFLLLSFLRVCVLSINRWQLTVITESGMKGVTFWWRSFHSSLFSSISISFQWFYTSSGATSGQMFDSFPFWPIDVFMFCDIFHDLSAAAMTFLTFASSNAHHQFKKYIFYDILDILHF